MTAFHVDGPTKAFGPGDACAPWRSALVRLQERRAERLARREFEAVFRAWTRGTPLPASVRRGAR